LNESFEGKYVINEEIISPLLWCWLSVSSDVETVSCQTETVSLEDLSPTDEILEPNSK